MTGERLLIKTGNRDVYGLDFRWIAAPGIERIDYPPALLAVEREEWGNAYGYLVEVREDGRAITTWDTDGPPLAEVQARLDRKQALEERIAHLEHGRIGAVSYAIEQLRLEGRALELARSAGPASPASDQG